METPFAGCRQAQAAPMKLSLLLTIKAFLRGQNLSGELNPFSIFSNKKNRFILCFQNAPPATHFSVLSPWAAWSYKTKQRLHQECWQFNAFLQAAQKGGGVPGWNWEEKKRGEGGFGNILCPRPAVRHTTGETTRAPRWKRRKTWMAWYEEREDFDLKEKPRVRPRL